MQFRIVNFLKLIFFRFGISEGMFEDNFRNRFCFFISRIVRKFMQLSFLEKTTLDKYGFGAKIFAPHLHLWLHGKSPIFSKNKVQNPYKKLKIHAKLRLIVLTIFPVTIVANP